MMSSYLFERKTVFDEKERIWRGLKMDIEIGADISLGRSVLEAMLKDPKHVSQICDYSGKEYTNEAVAIMSIRVAQHLQEMGFQQEDVVGICATNTDFVPPLAIGALLCGTILSTLDPSLEKDGLRHILSITKPKIMFCDGTLYKIVQAALADANLNIPIYTMRDHLDGAHQIQELLTSTGKEASFKVTPLKLGSSQTAAILFSSGTTGLPKGVCMSHESFLNTKVFNIHPVLGSRLFHFSTLYWISGVQCLFQALLRNCTRVTTDQPYSPEVFLRIVEQYKIKIVFTPPSQMAMAIQSPDFKQKDLSSLELYFCGGSAVPFAVIQAFSEHVRNCDILISYGMTEISLVCSFGKPTKPGANGQLMSNIEVKIIDESNKLLGIAERGEICIRTPFKWSGYYENQKATDVVYDKDGWIHSGDIGYFDDQGFLFIIDRKKDILKYHMYHFSPTEIEEVIMQIPDVVEVSVCGIPNILTTFLPAAGVVKLSNSKLTENDVSSYVAERMANYKRLRGGVYFLDLLPKTASGKNIRSKVTEIVKSLRDQEYGCNGLTNGHVDASLHILTL